MKLKKYIILQVGIYFRINYWLCIEKYEPNLVVSQCSFCKILPFQFMLGLFFAFK